MVSETSETGGPHAEVAKVQEKKSAAKLVAEQMASLGEYIKQLTTDPSSLKDLLVQGGTADSLLALQPSVLGFSQRNPDGEEVVVWGGEGWEAASILTREQLEPQINELLNAELANASGKEGWVAYSLRNQRRWRIPAGESVIVVDVHFSEADQMLKLEYASIETPVADFLPLADKVLDSVRDYHQGADSGNDGRDDVSSSPASVEEAGAQVDDTSLT